MRRRLQALDRAAQIDRARDVVQIVHRRMRQVVGAEHLFGLQRLVGHPFVGQRHDCQDHALLVAQGDVGARLQPFGELFGDVQRDGHRPQRARRQAHVADDAVIVGLGQKALQRVEAAVHQQLQIADLARRQVPAGHPPGIVLERGGRRLGDIEFGNGGMLGQGHGHDSWVAQKRINTRPCGDRATRGDA